MATLNFRKILTLIFILFLSISQFANAAPDIVAQNYAAANSPGIQSCTVGYDLLSGDIAYQQPLISSKLPYSLNYKAPLRLNLSAAQTFAQTENTTTGWSDNYQSSIIIQNINSKTTQYTSYRTQPAFGQPGYYWLFMLNPVTTEFSTKLIMVRLPGEKFDTVFKEEKGEFFRLYSADAVRDLNNYSINQLSWNTDLGEYTLNRINGNLVITKNGVRYLISSNNSIIAPTTTSSSTLNAYIDKTGSLKTTTSWWLGVNGGAGWRLNSVSNVQTYIETKLTASVDLYRVERIEAKGRSLDFQYDGNLNLTKVKDQYNNQLLFERTFHDTNNGTAQTVDESRLVTKVSYANAGQSTSQIAEFKYQSYDVRTPSTGIVSKVYALVESNSTAAGKNIYVNALTEIGAIKGYLRSKGRIADDSYNYPILRQVKNSLSEIVRQWDVTQNYSVAYFGRYNPAETTLRSFTPNTSGTAFDNTSVYNDIDGSITTSIALGGSTGSNTIQTTLDTSSTGKITISSSGYPCLTSGKTPVSSAEFNTERSRLNKITDANNVTSSFSYDMQGRLITATEAVGNTLSRTTSYVYGVLANNTVNPFTVPTEVKTSNLTIKNVIDVNGNITSQTQTSSQSGSTSKVTAYTYYSDASQPNYGLLNSVDGPRTGTTDKITYAYDNFGNLASQSQTINGAVRTTSYIGYNTFAQPERIVNPNGLVELFSYNDDGSISSKTIGPGGNTGAITGQTETFTYDALKRITSEKSPDGELTFYQYDQAGQVVLVILPNGNRKAYTYFSNGITASELLTSGQNIPFNQNYTQINNDGRVIKKYSGSNANRLYVTYKYDANGNILESTTAKGITERWTYDALNRVKTHTDGMGKVDTKDYDINDNIISAKDAVNAGSNPLSYRNGNVLTQEINSDFGTKTYAYNEADQLTQRIHSTRVCNYNNLDEVGRYRGFACASNNGGGTPPEYQIGDSYTYDQSRYGRLDKVTSSVVYDVNTYYSYDTYDRIVQKRQENLLWYVDTANKNLVVNYGYSTAGKQTSITLPSGRVIGYNYNFAAGTLTGINVNNSSLIRNINYDGANRIKNWSWGTGNASYSVMYSDNGVISSISNTNTNKVVNFSQNVGFDADGNISVVSRNNGLNDAYFYDQANRLTKEIRSNNGTNVYTITYEYDANGNRTSLNASGSHLQPAASATYAYSGNKLTSFNKNGIFQTLTQSANAEVAYGPFTAAYDNGGRRKADHAANYYYYMNYNHKNERITRGMSSNIPASVVQYVYDEDSHLIGEYSGNIPIVEYVWLGDKPVAAIYGTGAATKIHYIVADHLNTPRRLIDSSDHAVVWSWDSTAFGMGDPIGYVTFNLRFPGQYYDVGTGHFYNHNRFYNPELGRYMEPDPIGLGGGLNLYSYCYQNPIMFVDPNAAIPIPIITGAIGGIAGGVASVGAQLFINRGTNGFSWRSVGVAIGVGAVAGAISPWTATSAIGATVTGSLASTAQYGLTQWAVDQPTTATGYVASAALGGLGGGIAGAIPKPKYTSAPSTFITAQEATRVKNNVMWNMATGSKNLAYNFGGAAIAADPFELNSINIQMARNELYSNQYKNYQVGNPVNMDPRFWTGTNDFSGLHLEIIKGSWE